MCPSEYLKIVKVGKSIFASNWKCEVLYYKIPFAVTTGCALWWRFATGTESQFFLTRASCGTGRLFCMANEYLCRRNLYIIKKKRQGSSRWRRDAESNLRWIEFNRQQNSVQASVRVLFFIAACNIAKQELNCYCSKSMASGSLFSLFSTPLSC